MTPIATARRATALRRALLVTLPLLGACASVQRPASRLTSTPASDAGGETGRLLWVRSSAVAPSRVVVSGTPVHIRSGGRLTRGDTVFVDAPFAVALPIEAFELRIDASAVSPRPGAHRALAHVEFTSVSESGRIETVRAEGARLIVRRAAPGAPLELLGATRRAATPVGV